MRWTHCLASLVCALITGISAAEAQSSAASPATSQRGTSAPALTDQSPEAPRITTVVTVTAPAAPNGSSPPLTYAGCHPVPAY
jgi:hypothetical protein